MEISVANSYHPKIIGRKGQVIQKIRTDHAVQIQFPHVDVSESEADKIVLTGYEHNCEAAKEAILKIVRELVCIALFFCMGSSGNANLFSDNYNFTSTYIKIKFTKINGDKKASLGMW